MLDSREDQKRISYIFNLKESKRRWITLMFGAIWLPQIKREGRDGTKEVIYATKPT